MHRKLPMMHMAYSMEKKKRIVPSTWNKHQIDPEQTIKEKELEVFEKTKKAILQERPNRTVIRRVPSSDYTLSNMFSRYDALLQVLYLINADSTIASLEVYSKYSLASSQLFVSDKDSKRIRYSYSTSHSSSSIHNSSNNLSIVYVLDNKYHRLTSFVKSSTTSQRLKIYSLLSLLQLSIEYNKSILDLTSVFIKDINTSKEEYSMIKNTTGQSYQSTVPVTLAYLPIEKKKHNETEYLVFLVSLLIPTYTTMEQVRIAESIIKTKEVSELSSLNYPFELLQVLHRIYHSSKLPTWKLEYSAIHKESLKYLQSNENVLG
ncbi:hypothetical protein NEOKW01_1395 [Nematocida sp. AWRm80]|nr:hypothetical protein NEOKW01_1395 [Nematocida sp. AWRm80]